MRIRMPRRLLALSTAGLLLLAGCGSAAETQASSAASAGASAVKSCEKVNAELEAIKTELDGLRASAPKDPTAAVKTVNSVITRVKTLASQVNDPEVEKRLTALGTSLAALRDQVQAATNDPLAQAPAVLGKFRDAFNALGEVQTYCQSAT